MSTNERTRVRGVSIYRPIIYGNTTIPFTREERESGQFPENHTHRWTVAVRSPASKPGSPDVGGADDISHFIKRVSFKLHDTYANPNRNIDKPPYEVSETGWGEFECAITIHLNAESGEKKHAVFHHVKLHSWKYIGDEVPSVELALKHGPVHSWQYDELVFNDPPQIFYNTLLANPPTPLPETSKRPAPYHGAPGVKFDDTPGTPEFTEAMIKEEADRLDQAKETLDKEKARMLTDLRAKELKLEELKKQLAGGS